MKAPLLATDHPAVKLIEPDIERDAPLSVQWLAVDAGRDTLRLMGVPDAQNTAQTLEQERERVRSFLTRSDQLNWMVEYDQHVVGAIWVDLQPSMHLQSPSIHMMIGDPNQRRKGIGTAAMQAVIDYLMQTGTTTIYSRYLVDNTASAKLSRGLGFILDGAVYTDTDGLHWQNVVRPVR